MQKEDCLQGSSAFERDAMREVLATVERGTRNEKTHHENRKESLENCPQSIKDDAKRGEGATSSKRKVLNSVISSTKLLCGAES